MIIFLQATVALWVITVNQALGRLSHAHLVTTSPAIVHRTSAGVCCVQPVVIVTKVA